MLSNVVDSLVRHRRLAARLASARATVNSNKLTIDKYEIFSTAGPETIYRQAVSMKQARELADQLATQFPSTTISIWSPTVCHVAQLVANAAGEIKQLHGAKAR